MTLTIPVTPNIEQLLRERAAAAGKDPATYAAEVLTRDLTKPSLEELLAPFRAQVAQSGMSDEALDEFYRSLRDEVRKERRGNAA